MEDESAKEEFEALEDIDDGDGDGDMAIGEAGAPDGEPKSLDLILDIPLVAIRAHVDEIDDDQTTKIAYAKLPRNLFGCF